MRTLRDYNVSLDANAFQNNVMSKEPSLSHNSEHEGSGAKMSFLNQIGTQKNLRIGLKFNEVLNEQIVHARPLTKKVSELGCLEHPRSELSHE